jgi:hypothetical protein
VNPTAERIFARQAPLAEIDQQTSDLLEGISEALGLSYVDTDVVVREGVDGQAPWSAIADPDLCPARWLPWLAQWNGVKLLPSDTEQDQRERILQAAGFYRGTNRAIREEVARTTTSRDPDNVVVLNRVGGARWAQQVITRLADTPDPAAAERAALRQKSAGIVQSYLATDDVIWPEATLTFDAVDPGVTFDTVTLGDVT